MSVSAVSAPPTNSTSHVTATTPESAEGPGPDHDGDSDDKSVGSAAPVQSAPTAPGTGLSVNKVA
jgi:hypothetical protein